MGRTAGGVLTGSRVYAKAHRGRSGPVDGVLPPDRVGDTGLAGVDADLMLTRRALLTMVAASGAVALASIDWADDGPAFTVKVDPDLPYELYLDEYRVVTVRSWAHWEKYRHQPYLSYLMNGVAIVSGPG